MLEKIGVELEIVGRHLAIQDYLELLYALNYRLPLIPHLSYPAYRLSFPNIKSSEYKCSCKYGAKLHSDYYSDESFKFVFQVSDLETIRSMLLSHSVSIETLLVAIGEIIQEEIVIPQIGWEISKYLLDFHQIPIDPHYTSIMYFQAAGLGMLELVSLLILDLNAQSFYSHNEVFVEACRAGNPDMVEFLMGQQFIDINYREGPNGCSGFSIAAAIGNFKVFKLLLAEPTMVIEEGGLTYLLSCWRNEPKYMEMFEILMEDERAVWNELDNMPLSSLCITGLVGAVEKLLQRDDVDPAADSCRAVEYAVINDNLDILNLLLQIPSVNPFPGIFTFPCQSQNFGILNRLLQDPRGIVTINPLNAAISSKSELVIDFIVENNHLDLCDNQIRSALASFAVLFQKEEILKKLLKIKEISIDARLEAAIFDALSLGNTKAINFLISDDTIEDGLLWQRLALKSANQNRWELIYLLLNSPKFSPSFKKNELLTLSCEHSVSIITEKIVEHPNFTYQHEDGMFMALMRNSNIQDTRYLLENLPFDPSQKRNLLFRSACKYSTKEYIEYLLTLDKVDPTELNYQALKSILARKDDSLVDLVNTGKFGIDINVFNLYLRME
ncbi:hypothetical protein HK103_006537 [Boothiomyces macroporosus]|uniref:Ankyrin repeat protein n=1 Tax=Boothiomyces macroporosus TaxID=261099 RepID=A0AAD5UHN0_9FUNG|nr:hypothetical protein HK103_006537 [Boothiomyces macroporosus]